MPEQRVIKPPMANVEPLAIASAAASACSDGDCRGGTYCGGSRDQPAQKRSSSRDNADKSRRLDPGSAMRSQIVLSPSGMESKSALELTLLCRKDTTLAPSEMLIPEGTE